MRNLEFIFWVLVGMFLFSSGFYCGLMAAKPKINQLEKLLKDKQ